MARRIQDAKPRPTWKVWVVQAQLLRRRLRIYPPAASGLRQGSADRAALLHVAHFVATFSLVIMAVLSARFPLSR
jgi:hypothetical protein